jgi:hypothetical protein
MRIYDDESLKKSDLDLGIANPKDFRNESVKFGEFERGRTERQVRWLVERYVSVEQAG